MSYQVLARKWRPRDFGSLVGQEHVVRALRHALEQKRLHHAYLFTGTRGVGKTTLARILAKCLNCETGITPQPCGKCTACVEIDGGRFPDYVELDAASNRGVDDMTQLLERAVYAPTSGRFKVYVIDEAHQLSGHAFNAMLKTLSWVEGIEDGKRYFHSWYDVSKKMITEFGFAGFDEMMRRILGPWPNLIEHYDAVLLRLKAEGVI